MPQPSFALTKIQPPRSRAGLVARPALEAAMAEAALTQRLVLVAAPAGFGKTAALTRLIEQLAGKAAVAWIAADHDDDPLGLLACLIAALEPLDPPWRTDPDVLVAQAGASKAGRHAVAVQVLNALAACDVERGLVVVDDAHRIADPGVFEFLDVLLERLPPRWSFVVSSRTEPPLASLARLRAHGELAEFRQAALRFSAEEARALLPAAANDAGFDAEATSRRLVERTHGWAVGLRLAVSGLAEGHRPSAAVNETARDRRVFDYLVAEVLAELPEALRGFLLRTSVLAELTASRAAAVSGDARAAEWLDEIERRGLFVSTLQAAETTLRLHDLFRDFLQERVRREMAAELPGLHRRAAAGEADVLRRIGHLLKAGDVAEAEAALAEAGGTMVTTIGAGPVLHMIELFPREQREGSPLLAHIRCLCAWARWDWAAMHAAAAAARAGFEARGEAHAAWRSRIYEAIALCTFGRQAEALAAVADVPAAELTAFDRARAGIVRMFVALDRGDVATVALCFGAVLDEIETSRDAMLWYQCVPPSLQCGLPELAEPMRRFATGALRAVPDAPTPLRAIALSAIGWAELWSGRLAGAAEQAALAAADARWLGPPPNVRLAVNSLLAMLAALQGRAEASRRATAEVLALFDEPGGGYDKRSALYGFHRLLEVRLADIAGDGAAVLRLARALPADVGTLSGGARPLLEAQRHALPGRVAWHEGRWADARRAFESALAHESAMQVFGEAEEIRLRLALVCLRTGDAEAARAACRPVFAGHARLGCPGGALTLGAAGLRALADAGHGGVLSAAECALLREWAGCLAAPAAADASRVDGTPSAAATPSAAGAASPVLERAGLSRRELEVLGLIAAGESNKLIARAFDLSPHTVKRHVANILDKLGVQSRGQAAAYYREHAAG